MTESAYNGGRYAYNNQDRLERAQNPAGTITISTFDGLARLTGTYVGTDDSTTNGFKWTPSNAAPTSEGTEKDRHNP